MRPKIKPTHGELTRSTETQPQAPSSIYSLLNQNDVVVFVVVFVFPQLHSPDAVEPLEEISLLYIGDKAFLLICICRHESTGWKV